MLRHKATRHRNGLAEVFGDEREKGAKWQTSEGTKMTGFFCRACRKWRLSCRVSYVMKSLIMIPSYNFLVSHYVGGEVPSLSGGLGLGRHKIISNS